MSECDRFPIGSRSRQICTGEADLPISKINLYRKKWGLPDIPDDGRAIQRIIHDGKAIVSPVKKINHDRVDCGCSVPEKTGPGSSLKKMLKGYGVPPCQQCNILADKMNKWGKDGCESRIEEIVEDIFPRAKDWVAKNKPWTHMMLPNIVEDFAIKMKLKHLVKEAIEAS